MGTSLAVHSVRFSASTAGGAGSTPAQGTKFACRALGQRKTNQKKKITFLMIKYICSTSDFHRI